MRFSSSAAVACASLASLVAAQDLTLYEPRPAVNNFTEGSGNYSIPDGSCRTRPDDAPDAVFRVPLPTNGTAPLVFNVTLPENTTTWDANITAGIVWDNNPQAWGTTGFNLGLQYGTTIPIKANQVLYREPYTFSEPCSSFTLNTTLTMNRTDYLSLNPENGVIPSGTVGTLYIQITHEREYAHGFCSDVVFLDNYTAPSVDGCPAAELSPSSGAPAQLEPVLMAAAGLAMAAVGLVLA